MHEIAQVIDAYEADGGRWYEFWSLERQTRFLLKWGGGKELDLGHIVIVEEVDGRMTLSVLRFSSLPEGLGRTLIRPISYKPPGGAKTSRLPSEKNREKSGSSSLFRDVSVYPVGGDGRALEAR